MSSKKNTGAGNGSRPKAKQRENRLPKNAIFAIVRDKSGGLQLVLDDSMSNEEFIEMLDILDDYVSTYFDDSPSSENHFSLPC